MRSATIALCLALVLATATTPAHASGLDEPITIEDRTRPPTTTSTSSVPAKATNNSDGSATAVVDATKPATTNPTSSRTKPTPPVDPCTETVSVFDGLAGRPERDHDTFGDVQYVLYTRTCPTDTSGPAYRWVPIYTQAQLLQQLIAQARRQLPAPQASFYPLTTLSEYTFVRWPTFVWLEPATVAVTTLTARTPGLTVTATLSPTKMTVTPADHDPIVCNPNVTQPTQQFLDDHPPLKPTDSPLACEIRFTKTSKDQPNLKYPTTIQVAWNMTWTTTAGNTGTIPGVTTNTTANIGVASIQVINTSR